MICSSAKKKELEILYARLVKETQEYRLCEENKEKNYVLFGAIAGRNYHHNGLMIIGRATNGWHRYVDSDNDLFNGENRIFDYPEKLAELKNDNKKSRYWQVLSKIGENLFGDDWDQSILYSNYCKVAPDEESEPNGTPPKKLRNLQDETCKEILSLELEVFSPKHIIAFTGCNVDDMDFSERLMSALISHILPNYSEEHWPNPIEKISWGNGKFVLEIYKMGDTYVYLSDHPDRKPPNEHAKLIIKTLQLYFIKFNQESKLYQPLPLAEKYAILEAMRLELDRLYREDRETYDRYRAALKPNTWDALEENWKLWDPVPKSHVVWEGPDECTCRMLPSHPYYEECAARGFTIFRYDLHGSPNFDAVTYPGSIVDISDLYDSLPIDNIQKRGGGPNSLQEIAQGRMAKNLMPAIEAWAKANGREADFWQWRDAHDLVPHEDTDCRTMRPVYRPVHLVFKHRGGIANALNIKAHFD